MGQEGDRGRVKTRGTRGHYMSGVTKHPIMCCGLASVSCRIFYQPRPESPMFIEISSSNGSYPVNR